MDAQNIHMHETQVTHEDLSELSGVQLVIWAANHGYGPAVSYTDVSQVNNIVITVDGGGQLINFFLPFHAKLFSELLNLFL